MRVREVALYRAEARLERSIHWATGSVSRRTLQFLRLQSESGLVGWGECLHPLAAILLQQHFGPQLVELEFAEPNLVRQELRTPLDRINAHGGIVAEALGAIDIALWDLHGRMLDTPISDLLGGAVRHKIPVYASGLYYKSSQSDDDLMREAESYMNAGYRAVKMKLGLLTINEDLERVARVRRALGRDIKLMVDANQRYSVGEATIVGRKLAEHDVFWFEEPINARDRTGYRRLVAAQPLALAAGEVWHNLDDFAEYVTERVIQWVQPNIIRVGGLSEFRSIAVFANSLCASIAAHGWGGPIARAASLHVLACLPPTSLRANDLSTVLEADTTENPLVDLFAVNSLKIEAGQVQLPEGPGLGIDMEGIIRAAHLDPVWACETQSRH